MRNTLFMFLDSSNLVPVVVTIVIVFLVLLGIILLVLFLYRTWVFFYLAILFQYRVKHSTLICDICVFVLKKISCQSVVQIFITCRPHKNSFHLSASNFDGCSSVYSEPILLLLQGATRSLKISSGRIPPRTPGWSQWAISLRLSRGGELFISLKCM